MEVVIDIEAKGVVQSIDDTASELLNGQTSSVQISLSDTSATKEFDSINSFKCFACRAVRAKYRCPGCATPTCSLACVRKHKALLECDGQRSRVKFRRLEQFSNLDIQSDYRLLEEISRDNERKKRKPRYRNRESRKTRLKDNVRVLCDVVLHLLPPNFVRAKENDSSWDAKKKTAKWRIGWDFDGAVIQTAPMKDSVILKTALFQATSHMPKADRKEWKKLIGTQSIKLTLKQEKGMSGEHPRTLRGGGGGDDEDEGRGEETSIVSKEVEKSARWPANLRTTIASNLRGSTFIEFPTFKVEKLTPNAGKEGVVKEEADGEEELTGHDEEEDEAEDDVEESDAEGSSSEEEMEDDEDVEEDVVPAVGEAEEEEEAIDAESEADESDLNTSSVTGNLSQSLSSEVGGEEEERSGLSREDDNK